MLDRPQQNTGPLTVEVNSSSASTTVLVVDGEIDMGTAPLLEQAINASLEGGGSRVELDLTGVSFADSSALSLLLRTRNRSGPRLVVGRCSPNLERLFAITGVNPLLGRPNSSR